MLTLVQDALRQRAAHAASQTDESLRAAFQVVEKVLGDGSRLSGWIEEWIVRQRGCVRREPHEVSCSPCSSQQAAAGVQARNPRWTARLFFAAL